MKETSKARLAWADYLSMGPGRSLEKLLAAYLERQQNDSEATVPARRLRTLCQWSSQFGWQARLKEIADREAREAEEREAAYRREILEAGYAQAHERVKSLKDLASTLFEELQDPKKRWCQDVKQIGSGENAERVDIERFNAAEVEQFRGLLDDIAKEKGERKQKVEHSGPDGGKIEIEHSLSDDERAARIAALLERARARRVGPADSVDPTMGAVAGPADSGLPE